MTERLPNAEDFKREITAQIMGAKEQGVPYIELLSRDIHVKLGGYSNRGNHRMRTCCEVMRELMRPGDQIISGPDKGNGATLRIRYHT